MALSTPLSILVAQPAYAAVPPPPQHIEEIALQTPIQPTQLVEQPEVPDIPVPVPAPVVAAPVVSNVVSGCGDNFYANYIYMHESGCDTGRYNSIGCFGIGQSCPASKISYCGTDYACQNAWFTNYANTVYGGWAGAYSFWLQHSWW